MEILYRFGMGHMHLNDANVKMKVKFKEDPSGIALFPASTTHGSNVGPMLAHRLRRWPNIGPTLDRCVVFAGLLTL